ncbi:MAG: hypothetical protein LPK25_00060 [Cyclobacteriaceae bacterium]|nr:hypothetical protein [Cyclobacteriaceae bacterium]MDX5465231.1 hypothetical protein [Cyclobacteriaceae bacterium]
MAKDSQSGYLNLNQTFSGKHNLGMRFAVVPKGKSMKKKKRDITEKETSSQEEWNPLAGHGILPDGVSLTQNIGCAGGKNPKSNSNKKDNNE